jgi:cytochrome bd-type quinol oxidase subunit 2
MAVIDEKNENDKIFLIINIALLVVALMTSVAIILMLLKRSTYQPLMKKCPKLMFLSVIGNMTFCIIIAYQGIAYSGCKLTYLEKACNNETFARFNCFMGLVLLIVCEPLAMYPYVLRAIRLHSIE